MMKKLAVHFLTVIVVLFCAADGHAQPDEEKKFEVGVQFTTLGIEDPIQIPSLGLGPRTEAGFGGRFGYNLNRNFALEAEVNFFPRDYRELTTESTGGRVTQGLFGLKAGIHKGKFGFFGKVRPGFQSSGKATRARFPNGDGPDPRDPFGFEFIRGTQFSIDVGGVVEYYPSRRTIIRFDLGDTITRYPEVPNVCFPAGVPCPEKPVTHKVQFSAGFGFRF